MRKIIAAVTVLAAMALAGTVWAAPLISTTQTITQEIVLEPVEFEETFEGSLARYERDYICIIPAGATELVITLNATADLDIELWDDDTCVIGAGYSGDLGEIDSRGLSTGTYEGDEFDYSGWYGEWYGRKEFITADGPLGRDYDLKVYAYRAGDYTVTVSYIIPGPPNPPPTINIDVGLEEEVTITVMASDLDGVMSVSFWVWAPEIAELEHPIVSLMTFTDEGNITFTPGWTGNYTVEAWAVDELGSGTPEGNPETATFEVS